MVLELNKIPLSRGLFVTTSKFSPRARTIGVKCFDSDQLNQWERYAQRVFYVRRFLFRLISMTLFFAIGLITAVAVSPLLVERYPFLIEKSHIYRRLLKSSSQTNSNDIEAIKLWAMNNMAVLRLGFAEFRDAVNAAVEESLGGTSSSSSSSSSIRSSIPSLRSFFEDEENEKFETPLPVVLLFEALLKMNRGFLNGWRRGDDEQQLKYERKKKEEEEMKKKSMNRMLVDATDVLSSWYHWLEGKGGGEGDDRTKSTRGDSDNEMKKKKEEEEKLSFVAGSRLRNAFEKVKGILQQ
jgi:hypothetical protein